MTSRMRSQLLARRARTTGARARAAAIAGIVLSVALVAASWGCGGEGEAATRCVLREARSCGAVWHCDGQTYSYDVERTQALLLQETLLKLSCSSSSSDSPSQHWWEIVGDRGYDTLCQALRSAEPLTALPRMSAMCGWGVVETTRDPACSAWTGRYKIYGNKRHFVETNHSEIVVDEGPSFVARELSAEETACGPHRLTFSHERDGCVSSATLRYDATREGLVHGSLLQTHDCQVPGFYLYEVVELRASP